MSPHIILILMLSSVTLLIMLLVAIRKRETQKSGGSGLRPEPQRAPFLVQDRALNQPSDTQASHGAKSVDDLSQFDDHAIDEFLNGKTIPLTMNPQPSPNNQNDLIELISRYKFFQGKNLETFSKFVKEGDFNGMEQLIREKFTAQKKPDAEIMAKEVSAKLVTLMA